MSCDAYINTCLLTYIHKCMHSCAYIIYIQTYVCLPIYMPRCIHSYSIHTYKDMCIYIYIALIEFSTIFMVCIPSTKLYTFFWLRPFYCTVSHWYEEKLLPPRSTPLGAYGSASHTFGAVSLNHMPSQPYIPHIPHLRQVQVWWLGMF